MKETNRLIQEMADQIMGAEIILFSAVNGSIISSYSRVALDLQESSMQIHEFLGLGGVELEDVLMTTIRHHFLIRYLPGRENYIGILVDRKKANLGQVRLMSHVYSEKFTKALGN